MSAGVEAGIEATVLWRPMREEDLPAVAALEQASHAAPWSEGNFRDAFAAGDGRWSASSTALSSRTAC
jgi:ribosomal-protein-alanine N-acetyltransferase